MTLKSIRLSPELEARLHTAAQVEGISESELIRSAIDAWCTAVLSRRADQRLADVIGQVDLGGGVAEHTGEEFTKLLRHRSETERRAWAGHLVKTR